MLHTQILSCFAPSSFVLYTHIFSRFAPLCFMLCTQVTLLSKPLCFALKFLVASLPRALCLELAFWVALLPRVLCFKKDECVLMRLRLARFAQARFLLCAYKNLCIIFIPMSIRFHQNIFFVFVCLGHSVGDTLHPF